MAAGLRVGGGTIDEEHVELLHSVIDCMPSGVVVVDAQGRLVLHNAAARNALASRFVPLESCWADRKLFTIEGERLLPPHEYPLHRALRGEITDGLEVLVRTSANREVMLRINARPMLQAAKGRLWAVAVFQDIGEEIEAMRHQRELERQLLRAQKMESLGQLASGIAHEINTPTQYISDNMRFLSEAFQAMIDCNGEVRRLIRSGVLDPATAARVESHFEELELDFFQEEVPAAIQQSLEGLERVASIVRAMKEYAHPCDTKEPTDINHVVRTTVAMSKNEYKYVADLVLDLQEDLPFVRCVAGEISQVLLNLVVNAAHAIGDADRERGQIVIRTRASEKAVRIEVEDDGTGIPSHLRERIFEPFFTTKAVGKGTGQGLALAYDVVVRKHGGALDVRSTPGEGSTFVVTLPRLS